MRLSAAELNASLSAFARERSRSAANAFEPPWNAAGALRRPFAFRGADHDQDPVLSCDSMMPEDGAKELLKDVRAGVFIEVVPE
jgi:hypothetical protein